MFDMVNLKIQNWNKLDFDSITIKNISKKIKTTNYLKNGKYPIIDQGKKMNLEILQKELKRKLLTGQIIYPMVS